jgi:16S rRNA (guanine966-N2)-methyltransferase
LGEKALATLAAGKWLARDAVVVLEESVDTELNLPPGFVIELRREYGAAAVRLLSYDSSAH